MTKAYLIYEHDGTSISAPPKLIGVTLDKAHAEQLERDWDPQVHWSSLGFREVDLIEPEASA